MYANLLVRLNSGEELYAHEITFPKNGRVLVHLDDPEDESSYCAPAGLRSFEPADVDRITACF